MNLVGMEKKNCNGRKKIEIKRIEKEKKRQVCFTKRRQGLFKKANELCTLCGAEIAIVVFSLAGKPYFFGHPSVDHVLGRFHDIVPSPSATSPPAVTNCNESMIQDQLVSKPFWWDIDVSSMGIEDLTEYGNILLDHHATIAQTAQQCDFQVPQATTEQIVAIPRTHPQVGEEGYFLWLQQQDYEFTGEEGFFFFLA